MNQVKKKNIKIFSIVFVLVFIVFSFLFFNGLYTETKYKISDNNYEIDLNKAGKKNISIKDNHVNVLDNDAYFTYNGKKIIQSVEIDVDKLSSKDTNVQIYYSNSDGGFNESKSIIYKLKSGENYIRIPSSNSRYFMIKFTNDIELNAVKASADALTIIEKTKSGFNIIMYLIEGIIVSLIISILITINNLYDKLVQKVSSLNKKDILSIAKKGSIILGTIITLCVFQKLFTKQFVFFNGESYILNYTRLVFTIAVSVIFWGLIWLRESLKSKVENIFLLLSLTIGISFAIINPFFQEVTWDAAIHYGSTVDVVYFAKDKTPLLDKSVGLLENSYNISDVKELVKKYDVEFEDSTAVDSRNFSLTNIYNSLGYIPLSAGVFIARGLSLPLTASIILGRLFNVCFFSFIVYFGIKKLKYGKMGMFIIALYPTVQFQSGSYTYDCWVLGLVFMGLAYLFENIRDRNNYLTLKDAVIILTSLFIGCGPKAIYFPIMLLCFFMPKTKFRNNKSRYIYYVFSTITMLTTVVSFLVPFVFGVASGTAVGDTRGGEDVNSTKQVMNILSHPFEYTKILLNHMRKYWGIKNAEMYITTLGYSGTSNFFLINIITMVFYLIVGDEELPNTKGNNVFKVFTVLLVFGISCLIATAFYIAFTPVGLDIISGCQARYLLPIIFPLIYALRNTYKTIKINPQYVNGLIVISSSFVLVHSFYLSVLNFTIY